MLHSRLVQSNHEPRSLALRPAEPEIMNLGKRLSFGHTDPGRGPIRLPVRDAYATGRMDAHRR